MEESDNQEPTLVQAAELLGEINDYFANHLVGIVYSKQRDGKPPERHCVASSFIGETHGYPVFVTAGHALAEIFKWAESGHRKAVSFIVPTRTGKVEEIPWEEELFDVVLHWYDESGELDFGIVPVSEHLLHRLKVNDIGIVHRGKCWDPSDTRNRIRLLIGFSGEHLKFMQVEQLVIPDSGKWKPILRSEFSGIATRLVHISQTTPGDDFPKVKAEPLHNENASVAGLSGGLVVDIFFGSQIRDYAWVGVQSSETRVEKKGKQFAKDLTFIDSRAVVQVIDDYIADLRKEHPDVLTD